MRDLFPVIVHTLLIRDERVLLLRRARTGYLDGWYALPGGHLQHGETVVACALRECLEETGIALDPARLRPLAVMPYRADDQQGINFIMQCDSVAAKPALAEPDKFDEVGWWSIAALPPQTVPYLARALEMRRSGDWFVEFPEQSRARP